MRVIPLIIWLIFLTSPVFGQDKTYSFEFRDTPMQEALLSMENASAKRFYFAREWVDTLQVNQTITSKTLNETLDQIFEGTKLGYVVFTDRVILTYNAPIVLEIPKLKTEEEELVYVYSREYVNQLADEENRTFEIGEKAKLRLGGTATLAGFVREKDSDVPVIGAAVYIPNTSIASITDSRGFYSLNLPRGLNRISIQFTGMKTTKRNVMMYSEGSLNIEMIPDVIMLEDVLLEAERDANITTVSMGIERFNISEMKNVPKILGENDIVQIALALPGVQNVGEGSGGINVRGGKVDQNLMMLNQATIYNPFHFFGFFSSFNADVIGDAQLYKSSMPAQYGGRLSSVFDVEVKKGNKDKFSGQGGISPVTTRLGLEIPIIKGSTSLVTGFRTTYSDWVLSYVEDENIKNSKPFFLDGVIGIDHRFSDRSQIQASAYYSKDEFSLSSDSLYSYTNLAASLIWDYSISDKTFLEVDLTYSDYDFAIDYLTSPENAFEYGFEVSDYALKVGLDHELNEKHQLKFGGESRLYKLNPGFMIPGSTESEVENQFLQEETGIENAVYISDDWTVNDKLSISAGLRFSIFSALGPRTLYSYSSETPLQPSTIEDTVTVSSGAFKTYAGPEYRIAARYTLSPMSSVKLSVNRTRQYIHILSNTISVAPTDTWKLSDNNIQPQIADQISAGYYQNLSGHSMEASVEVYYKDFQNLLDYKTGAMLQLNELIETDVLQGDGFAYGVEFLFKKKTGKLNGWVSYTYSRSKQRFSSRFLEETINNGSYFPTNFDKPHDFSLVSNYKLTRRYSVSLNVNYSTGRPITYPTGKYVIGGSEVVQYSDRNAFRLPDYFRVDLGVNIEGSHKIKKLAHSFWTISVYNLLGRDNVYSIFFVPEDGQIKGYQLSVFASPIPTITYNFRF